MTEKYTPAYLHRTNEQKQIVNREIGLRNPGLVQVLQQLRVMMGPESTTRADIPIERVESADNGLTLEDLNTNVRVYARNAKGVRVLHKIIAYGVAEYLADDSIVCYCGEAIDGYKVTAGAAKGQRIWWHRATGSEPCADGDGVAEPDPQRSSIRSIGLVSSRPPVPGGFSG